MSDPRSLTPIAPSDYDLIEAAVMETARGRWFLAEFARRNRNADTDVLLQAIARLENAVAGERDGAGIGRFRGDLLEMAEAIARTKTEIAAITAPDHDHSRLFAASEALDAIVRTTERATSDILSAAEEVQEAAWTLRETGAESDLCDALDQHATQIYTACSFQDITAQRISRIIHTLRYLEKRIASMIAIWGPAPEDVPQPPSAADVADSRVATDLCQTEVDRFLDAEQPGSHRPSRSAPAPGAAHDDELAFRPEDAPASSPPADANPKAAHSAPIAPADDLALAFEDLDALSIEEKIALFT